MAFLQSAFKSLAPCVGRCFFRGPRYSRTGVSGADGPNPFDFTSLEQWIDSDGFVDYEGLVRHPEMLFENMRVVEGWRPEGLTREGQLAFYINAYNIVTMCMVLERMVSNSAFKGNLSSWDKLSFFALENRYIAGNWMTLDHLEHKIIRAQFNDPHIHCAINCGSYACPRLRRTPFTAEGLEAQLEARTRDFVNAQGGVRVDAQGNLTLSKIFEWYRCDFDDHGGGLVPFIQRYWGGEPISASPTITFVPYDWRLNSSANYASSFHTPKKRTEGKKVK